MSVIARYGLISGKVQGVYYRQSTRQQAQRLGVAGWVRNRVDGSVECYLEGEEDAVAELERWLWQGPPAAQVQRVTLHSAASEGISGFEVRHD